ITYLTRSFGNTFLIIALFATAFTALGILYYTLPKRKLVIHRRYILNQARQQQKLANAAHSKVINIQTKEAVQEQAH
ncbi:MAG TPA: undecaprenyl/decaprenyl-phosphate alpha-N-acetylglucosaminyl 1-phosphate transferase, partial [Niabella sp.]